MSKNYNHPEKIRIAGQDFDIDHCEILAHQNRYGVFNSLEKTIKVDFEAKDQALDTLLHEILHGVYWQYNIKPEDDEERTVTTMATGLTQIFKDNPEFIDWIKTEATKK